MTFRERMELQISDLKYLIEQGVYAHEYNDGVQRIKDAETYLQWYDEEQAENEDDLEKSFKQSFPNGASVVCVGNDEAIYNLDEQAARLKLLAKVL